MSVGEYANTHSSQPEESRIEAVFQSQGSVWDVSERQLQKAEGYKLETGRRLGFWVRGDGVEGSRGLNLGFSDSVVVG